MKPTAIHLIVALPAEAKPIYQHFRLQRDNAITSLPLYCNHIIKLAVSGPGKVAAQNAAKELKPFASANTHWINLGIAGHAKRSIGEAILARSIYDMDTHEEWKLPSHKTIPCDWDRVITVSKALAYYPDEGTVEMEASGFFRGVTTTADKAQISCMKIISDNRDHLTEQINGKMVSKLVHNQLDTLQQLMEL